MIPVHQECPQCRGWFMGSDIVGLPCPYCMGMNEQSLTEALAAMNQMYYQPEEETNDKPRSN